MKTFKTLIIASLLGLCGTGFANEATIVNDSLIPIKLGYKIVMKKAGLVDAVYSGSLPRIQTGGRRYINFNIDNLYEQANFVVTTVTVRDRTVLLDGGECALPTNQQAKKGTLWLDAQVNASNHGTLSCHGEAH